MRNNYLIITFLFLSLTGFSQDRYMVFFSDKNGTEYSIDRPEEFLSQRAIERRSNQQIAIISEDLPINDSYVNSIESFGVEVFFKTKWMNGVLVQMDENQVQLVEGLPFVNSVEFVADDAPLQPRQSKSEDPPVGSLNLASQQQQMLGIDQMHEYGVLGEGLIIGIFDDGFQNVTQLDAYSHIFNEERLLYTFDFVNNQESVENGDGHGTRVLSIIGAKSSEYLGGAPDATFILSVTEAPQEYRVEEYNWLFATERADSAGVDIINTSLGYKTGFSDPSMNYTDAQLDGETTVITRAANIAASKGIVLVVSAGNSGNLVGAPADSPNVLAVGAVDSEGELAGFSSRGTNTPNTFKPDVVAQGVGTLLLTADGSLAAQNGTSFSAPLMTSLVAGVWQAYPNKTADEVRTMIKAAGDRADNPDNLYGFGIPSFRRVVENEQIKTVDATAVYSAFPNPTVDDIQLNFDEKYFGEELTIQIINSSGEIKNQYLYVPFGSRNPLSLPLEESGIYLIRVISNSKTTTRKIIKY